MYISLIHSHIPNDPLVSLRSHAQGKQSHTLGQCFGASVHLGLVNMPI